MLRSPTFQTGDLNLDGVVDVVDIVKLVEAILIGEEIGVPEFLTELQQQLADVVPDNDLNVQVCQD